MGHGVRLILCMGPGGEGPVGVEPQPSAAEDDPLARQQLPDVSEHARPRRPAGADEQQLRHAVLVHLRRHRRVLEQGLQLRGEHQTALRRQGVEQGLHSHPVPGQEQGLRLRLPDGEGEDAVALLHTGGAPLYVGLQQHLCVGVAPEGPARQQQGPPQLFGVVQLSVVHQGAGPPLPAGGHGLTAVFRVDDAQPGVDQQRVGALENALLVRPPAAQDRLHPLRPGQGQSLFISDFSGNTAHDDRPPETYKKGGHGTPRTPLSALLYAAQGRMVWEKQENS